ncbi:MAG: hypothetical protein V7746_11095 [Halioglobus sp.]
MKCIVHIGTEKTGTTTIQSFLQLNRKRLLDEQGVAYLGRPKVRNHHQLAQMCRGNGVIARESGYSDVSEVVAKRLKVAAALKRDVGKLPAHVHTVILSSEYFQSRLSQRENVQNLQDMLAPVFEDVRILCYLRRQDEVAVSRYSTKLRAGFANPDILTLGDQGTFYDYLSLVKRWARVFGWDAFECAVFDRAALYQGDLLQDFARRVGITHDSNNLVIPERVNESLSGPGQNFYCHANRLLMDADDNRDNCPRVRILVKRFVNTHYSGKSRLPSRSEAAAFYDNFREDNARIARRMLGSEQLFEESFDKYPTQPESEGSYWQLLVTTLFFFAYSVRHLPVRKRRKSDIKVAK